MSSFKLEKLSYVIKHFDVESKTILKAAIEASRLIGELKSLGNSIPNDTILLNTLTLQEAQESSAIENIFTTQDALFKAQVDDNIKDLNIKEVKNYAEALKIGFSNVKYKKLLSLNCIKEIQSTIIQHNQGFRIDGNIIANAKKEVIYTPPQDTKVMNELLTDLERYINDDTYHPIDPLIKMSIIHYQFESIHPFTDGNGRTGRIINILYLVLKGLLDSPILYLSSYINLHKSDYYRLLQAIRDNYKTPNEEAVWQEYILFTIKGLQVTSKQAITKITAISNLMQQYKSIIRDKFKLPFYSQDLINHLFTHPYTKIDYTMKTLGISRQTAARYLKTLVKHQLLKEIKIGKSNYYFNPLLWDILTKP